MSLPDECVSIHTMTEFQVSEHRSIVRFVNLDAQQVYQIKVDGCAVTTGERCDWLINFSWKSRSIFVELKGSDMDKAYSQLAAATETLASEVKENITWIISYSGSPRFSTNQQVLTERARRDHNIRLLVKGSPYTYVL